VQVIGQRLQVFCDSVWGAAKRECEYPCDEETGKPMEFPDPNAFEAVEGRILVCAVQQALQGLATLDAQVGAWYLLEGLNEQAIAARLGVSQPAVSKRLKRILAQLRRELGAENAEKSP
jgi:RNA polymerase sigma factor (sigma-70 family)